MLGCIPHGRRNRSWRKNHGYAAHIQYTWTHSWRQSETEERQYSMRQASGLQSTIPASSYLVGGVPGTRPNQTRRVWSVKGHGAFDSAHVPSSLWFCFFFLLRFEILWPSALTLRACFIIFVKSATASRALAIYKKLQLQLRANTSDCDWNTRPTRSRTIEGHTFNTGPGHISILYTIHYTVHDHTKDNTVTYEPAGQP